MAVTYDEPNLNVPEAWRGDPQIVRFVDIIYQISRRIGGGANDQIDSLTAGNTGIASRVTTLELKAAILENKQENTVRRKPRKTRDNYVVWGVL